MDGIQAAEAAEAVEDVSATGRKTTRDGDGAVPSRPATATHRAPSGLATTAGQVVPRWAAVSLAAALTGGTVTALGWLVLAMVGALAVPGVLAVALLLGAPVAALTARAVLTLPTVPSTRARSAWWLGALALAAVATVWNGAHHAEHLAVERDPGVYIVTAKWLSSHGDLRVDGPTGAFSDEERIRPGGPGFSGRTRGEGSLDPQFAHLTPVVVAVGAMFGGEDVLFLAGPVLGGVALLVLFAVAATVMRPWWALVATAGLAACYPFTYFTRDLYSEPLALALAFGALFLWELANIRVRPLLAGAAGLLVGAICATRIDGFVSVIPAAGVFALYAAGGGAPGAAARPLRWAGLAALAGLVVAATLGWADLAWFSASYYNTDLSPRLPSLLAAAVVAAVAGAVLPWVAWRRPSAALRPVARVALVVVTVGAVVAVGYARLVRPETGELGRVLEARPELATAGSLAGGRIREMAWSQAMAWLDWYLGPVVVALGVAGVLLLLWRGVSRDGPRTLLLLCGMIATITIVYVASPQIGPDQPWAMRRFLPLTLPGLLVAAAWVLSELTDLGDRWGSGRGRVWRGGRSRGANGASEASEANEAGGAHLTRGGRGTHRGRRLLLTAGGVVGAVLLVVPAGQVTWPLRDLRVQVPLRQGVEAACAEAGDDAAILVAGARLAPALFPDTLRAFCGVPSGGDSGLSGDDVLRLQEEWERRGRELVVVSGSRRPFPGLTAGRSTRVFRSRLEHTDRPLTDVPQVILPDARLGLSSITPTYDLWVLRDLRPAP